MRFAKSKTLLRWKSLAAFAFLFLGALVALPTAPASARSYDFVGRWMNFDHDSSGITGILITPSRDGLTIRLFGLCRGQSVCDWDVARANLYSTGGRSWGGFNWGGFNWTRDTNIVTATFDVGYAKKFIVLRREGNDELSLEVFTDSRDRYGPGFVTESTLHRWGKMTGYDRNQDNDDDQDYHDGGHDHHYQDDHGH